MPIIDGLIVIGAIGIVTISILGISALRRKIPEVKGEENAKKVEEQGKRRCHFCRKQTNSQIDVYDGKHWYCLGCYTNETKN